MKVQRKFDSMDSGVTNTSDRGGRVRRHIRGTSRVLPALASNVPDWVALGKDGVQSSAATLPKVINIRK